MKAIIPVAGAGVRLRPHTYTQPKPLILVAGKPIISFIIDQLLDVGVDEFVFVLGYLSEKIKSYLDTAYMDINKTYVYQEHRRGLGDAILSTADYIRNDDEIIILLGDTILDLDLNRFLETPGSVLATQKVTDPRQFGVVEKNQEGRVVRVIEKPNIPISNLAIAGLYKFDNVGELIASLSVVSERAEISGEEVQLTDAIMLMIEKELEFSTFEVSHWYDCGKKDILLETNKMLLEKLTSDVGTRYVHDHSIIIPPVVFGKSCQFKNAIIGPHVTLGDNVHIEGSMISDSILGHYVLVKGAVLTKSVIGNDAVIRGLSQSLNIGDNNEIDFTQ